MERLPATLSGLTSAPRALTGLQLAAPAALLLVLVLGSTTAFAGLAKAPPGGLDVQQTNHLQALADARQALGTGGLSEPERASRAITILQARAPGELEVVQFLQAHPPDTADARSRLDTNIAAFEVASSDPNPVTTEQRLRQVLAQSRYHPDEGPLAAIAGFIGRLVDSLLRPGQGVLQAILLLLLAGLLGLVVILAIPALRNPLLRRRRVFAGLVDGSSGVPEYFATADRLAAEADYGAAVRALVAGTMELISGERSFAASPLTVRETFRRSDAMQVLRPLLLAFERSYYGHHDAAQADYAAAGAAARAYRDRLSSRDAA